MARKTFISYKYSEARVLRDSILKSMGNDAIYYRGETSLSPSMADKNTDYIKDKLKNMIYSTSVTIVIISPQMKLSEWIDWEIKYSLREVKRGDRYSGTNGIIGVVMEYNGGYSWLRQKTIKNDGCVSITTNSSYFHDIILKNRYNQHPVIYSCTECKTIDSLNGSYISLVNENEFLSNPNFYIENAYLKSKKVGEYLIAKQ
ncbi:TIR domain-containing protein [Enterococcus gallinarum]|uniref:TIR domain-containing protein n=1 Tax=Enterococcus TaxID=1350 RepID=UPI003D0EF569